MKNQSIRKIIFTGPESTGKTTEAMKLAFVNQLPIVYEYARTYLEEKGMTYKMTDLYNILEKQYDLEDEAQSQSEVIVCDTDWLTIHVWAMEVFGKRIKPPYDMEERHYILCPPNIPWEPDPLRENPLDRDRLYEIYVKQLERLGASYEVLRRK